MAEIRVGAVIDERYRLLERVGSGGMADVFCAEDLQLGRKVALKLLHARFAADEEFVERFRREAQSAAGLQHPNVVGIYDRGEWEGTWYIAMEYLPGLTLKDLIRAEAPLDPVRAVDIAIQVVKAARFAHRRGVIHRDLKPHNVIVDGEDRVKVTDFGIARAGASDMTETGSILGTAQYLSPEQAQGHAVSARSDLYSIGVILYEMLTGRLPFEAETAVSIALKHVTEAPPSPRAANPAVPPELDQIVLWTMQKAPERRPADAEALLGALEQAREHIVSGVPAGQPTATFAPVPASLPEPVPAPPPVVPVPLAYPEHPYPAPEEEEEQHGRRWPWIAGVIVALLLIGGGAAAYVLTRPDKVAVPNVVGESLDVAQARLQNDGFVVSVIRRTSARPKDQIISEIPLPGEKLPKGETVTLTVSDGPGQGVVPQVTGLSLAAAQKALKKAGFRSAVQRAHDDSVAAGRVVSSEPGPGSQLVKGNRVTLVVSTGPQLLTVPDVVGRADTDAKDALRSLGLTVTETKQDSAKDPGTVLSESPGGGTQVRKGTTIVIVVAQAGAVKIPDVTGKSSDAAVNQLSDAGFPASIRTKATTNPAEDGTVLSQAPTGKAKKGTRVVLTVGKLTPPTTPTTPTIPTTPTTPTTPTIGVTP